MTRTTRSTRTLSAAGTATAALGAGLALALIPAVSASAHVSASATSTAAGSYTVVTFSVPHGCEGSPTLGVEIGIPESILSVTPTINPNWTVAKNTVALDDATTDAHGAAVTDRIGSITYTTLGEGLADGFRDTFELSLQLPDGAAGDAVEFPVTQTCAEGTAEWTGDDVPTIVLTSATTGDGHGHDEAPDAEAGADATGEATQSRGEDTIARIIGITGLAVGLVGLIVGVVARRSQKEV